MRFLFFHLKKLYKSAHRAALALEQQLCLVRAVLHLYPTHIHRLIIPRWANRFVFLQIEPFALLFWALGITRAYTATGDPAHRPVIPQLRYSRAAES